MSMFIRGMYGRSELFMHALGLICAAAVAAVAGTIWPDLAPYLDLAILALLLWLVGLHLYRPLARRLSTHRPDSAGTDKLHGTQDGDALSEPNSEPARDAPGARESAAESPAARAR